MPKTKITVIGAGLAGCFLALLLAKRGYQITIYEKLSKREIVETSSKRSFNLTFYNYGMQALKTAGMWEDVKPLLIPLKGSVTQISKNTEPIFVRFDYQNMPYFAIQRSKLLDALIKAASKNPLIAIHFDTTLLSVDRQNKTMLVQNTKSQKNSLIKADIILGADGANSQVRTFLQQGQNTHHIQEYINWEYKQIIITKDMAKKMNLLENTQHAWTREKATFIAFPNGDDSFTAMLILPKNQTNGFNSLRDTTKIKSFFTNLFPDFLPALSEITDPIMHNPTGSFVTIFTSPWYYKDFMAIFGDAAHACLPFYGVGMSVAFGDCMEFASLIDQYGENWNEILPRYQELRKKHTDVIANLAKESFLSFRRHKRGDETAIYNRFEALFHTLAPAVFRPPLFNLVANDPNNAAHYFAHHTRQRRIAKFLGLPIAVKLLSKGIDFKERIHT